LQHQRATVQHAMQRRCNMSLKDIANKTLMRLKNATNDATTVQQTYKKCCNTKKTVQHTSFYVPNEAKKSHHETSSLKGATCNEIDDATSDATTWDEEELSLIQWFLSAKDLPTEPFQIKKGVTVCCPQKFYEELREQIEIGPNIRTIFGSIKNELTQLRKICSK
jgi:hypothetical protein